MLDASDVVVIMGVVIGMIRNPDGCVALESDIATLKQENNTLI